VLGVIRSEVIDDLDATVDLPKDQPCSREDNLIKLIDETEEVGVERDAFSDATVKIFDVIVGLEAMHIHRYARWTNFANPEAHDVAFVEEHELATCCGIHDTSDLPLDLGALLCDFVGRQ